MSNRFVILYVSSYLCASNIGHTVFSHRAVGVTYSALYLNCFLGKVKHKPTNTVLCNCNINALKKCNYPSAVTQTGLYHGWRFSSTAIYYSSLTVGRNFLSPSLLHSVDYLPGTNTSPVEQFASKFFLQVQLT